MAASAICDELREPGKISFITNTTVNKHVVRSFFLNYLVDNTFLLERARDTIAGRALHRTIRVTSISHKGMKLNLKYKL